MAEGNKKSAKESIYGSDNNVPKGISAPSVKNLAQIGKKGVQKSNQIIDDALSSDDEQKDGVYDSIKDSADKVKGAKNAVNNAVDDIQKLHNLANKVKSAGGTSPGAKGFKSSGMKDAAKGGADVGKAMAKGAAKAAETTAKGAAAAATLGVSLAASASKEAIKKAAKLGSQVEADKFKKKKEGGTIKTIVAIVLAILFIGSMSALTPLAIIGSVSSVLSGALESFSIDMHEKSEQLSLISDNGETFWGEIQDYGQKVASGSLELLGDAADAIRTGGGKLSNWITKQEGVASLLGITDEELSNQADSYNDSVDYKSAMNNLFGTVDFYCEKTLAKRREQLAGRTTTGDLTTVEVNGKTYPIDPVLTLNEFDKQGNPFAGKNNSAVAAAYATYDSDYATSNLSKLENILDKNWETLLSYTTIKTDETGGINNEITWDTVEVPAYKTKKIKLNKDDYKTYLVTLGNNYPVGAQQINQAVIDSNQKALDNKDYFSGLGFDYFPSLQNLKDKQAEINDNLINFENKENRAYGHVTPSQWYEIHGKFENNTYDAANFYLPSCIGTNISLENMLTQSKWKEARTYLLGFRNISEKGMKTTFNGHTFTQQDQYAMKIILGREMLTRKSKKFNQETLLAKDSKIPHYNVSLEQTNVAKAQIKAQENQEELYEKRDEVANTISSYESSGFDGGFTWETASKNIEDAENGQGTYGMIIKLYLPDSKNVEILVPDLDSSGNQKVHKIDSRYAPKYDSELAGLTYETKQSEIDSVIQTETDRLLSECAAGYTIFSGYRGKIEWRGFDLPDSSAWDSGAQVYAYNNAKQIIYPNENAKFYLRIVLEPFQTTDVFKLFDLDPDAEYVNSTRSKGYAFNTDTNMVEETGTETSIEDSTWTDVHGGTHTTHITNEQMYNNYYRTIASQMDGANTLNVGSGGGTNRVRSLSDDDINRYLSLAQSQGASKNRLQFLKNGMSIAGMVPYASDGYGEPECEGWNEQWGTQTGNSKYTLFGLDCSGFIQWSEETTFHTTEYSDKLGSTYSMVKTLTQIQESELRPGDIGVTVNNGRHHCGIYMGKDESGNQLWLHQPGPTSADLGPVVKSKIGEFESYYRNPASNIEGEDAWTDGIPTYGSASGDVYYYFFNSAKHEDGNAWQAIAEAMCNYRGGGVNRPVDGMGLEDEVMNPHDHHLWDGALTQYERIAGYVFDEANAQAMGLKVGDPLPDRANAIYVTYKNRKIPAFKWPESELYTPTEDEVATLSAIANGQRNYITDDGTKYWRGGISSLSGYTQTNHYGGTYFFKKN